MKKDIGKRWVAALRSGEYEQGTGALYKDGKYCCLGVLCDLYAKERNVRWRCDGEGVEGDMYSILGEAAILPYDIQIWSGLTSRPVVRNLSLTYWNDNRRASFGAIADMLEEELENVQ